MRVRQLREELQRMRDQLADAIDMLDRGDDLKDVCDRVTLTLHHGQKVVDHFDTAEYEAYRKMARPQELINQKE